MANEVLLVRRELLPVRCITAEVHLLGCARPRRVSRAGHDVVKHILATFVHSSTAGTITIQADRHVPEGYMNSI